MTRDGEAVEVHERARPDPAGTRKGRLTRREVTKYQALIARGLASQGLTRDQISQVIVLPVATLDRRMANPRPC